MAVNTEPAWYQKWLVKNEQDVDKPVLSMNPLANTITLCAGETEMLRVAEDGFYVRGVRVPADDKESSEVYNAFKQWLNWHTLTSR
jgi:hypothetical protein